jgi:hypothetical protein
MTDPHLCAREMTVISPARIVKEDRMLIIAPNAMLTATEN